MPWSLSYTLNFCIWGFPILDMNFPLLSRLIVHISAPPFLLSLYSIFTISLPNYLCLKIYNGYRPLFSNETGLQNKTSAGKNRRWCRKCPLELSAPIYMNGTFPFALDYHHLLCQNGPSEKSCDVGDSLETKLLEGERERGFGMKICFNVRYRLEYTACHLPWPSEQCYHRWLSFNVY